MSNILKNPLQSVLIFILAQIVLIIPALAQPVLRDNIIVNSPIVTVGDMFDNAGTFAETPLFRAPAPGTKGRVGIQIIRVATTKAGFESFENPGFTDVSVARAGILVDNSMLSELISADLDARGVLGSDVSVKVQLDQPLDPLYAANTATPVTLKILRYFEASNRFSARFELAGNEGNLDISGRLNFSISAPYLVRTLSAGTILQQSDLQLRDVALRFARSQGVPTFDQLLGKQLQRQMRDGTTIRLNDVAEPILISRNQIVTLFLKSGALTLTVKGQALANAARGEVVSVLNLLSNTVVQGIATDPGTVQILSGSERVASL
ncbi:MAG: flagellar basal body P-ring formation chaperone FlgA [Halocynthiibacter sp.]